MTLSRSASQPPHYPSPCVRDEHPAMLPPHPAIPAVGERGRIALPRKCLPLCRRRSLLRRIG
eukprot:1755339-Rhodomonas_salina.1